MAGSYLLDPGIDCQQSLCTVNRLLMSYMTETLFVLAVLPCFLKTLEIFLY
jgi:hypothetical protein